MAARGILIMMSQTYSRPCADIGKNVLPWRRQSPCFLSPNVALLPVTLVQQRIEKRLPSSLGQYQTCLMVMMCAFFDTSYASSLNVPRPVTASALPSPMTRLASMVSKSSSIERSLTTCFVAPESTTQRTLSMWCTRYAVSTADDFLARYQHTRAEKMTDRHAKKMTNHESGRTSTATALKPMAS